MKSYLFAVIIFLLLQKAFPQAKFSVTGKLCENNTLIFTDESLVNASAWNWDFGDGSSPSDQQNPTHSYADSGSFKIDLTITYGGNKTSVASQTKHISAHPIVGFNVDSTKFYSSTYSRVFVDSSVTFNPVSQYTWNFGDGSVPVSTNMESHYYKYSDQGTYNVWLKLTDNQGCTDSSSRTIEIHNRYYIPNVFTPNDDDVNREFIVTSNGETKFSIEIYSRWGNLVFKRSGQQQIVWDGRLPDGSRVTPGTYYYVINSESGNITYEPEKGFITVFY